MTEEYKRVIREMMQETQVAMSRYRSAIQRIARLATDAGLEEIQECLDQAHLGRCKNSIMEIYLTGVRKEQPGLDPELSRIIEKLRKHSERLTEEIEKLDNRLTLQKHKADMNELEQILSNPADYIDIGEEITA